MIPYGVSNDLNHKTLQGLALGAVSVASALGRQQRTREHWRLCLVIPRPGSCGKITTQRDDEFNYLTVSAIVQTNQCSETTTERAQTKFQKICSKNHANREMGNGRGIYHCRENYHKSESSHRVNHTNSLSMANSPAPVTISRNNATCLHKIIVHVHSGGYM